MKKNSPGLQVHTSEDASLIDKESIQKYGIDSRLLMGWAGHSAFTFIRAHENFEICDTLHFFCGKGNNAGDGYVIAWQILSSSEKNLVFWMMGEPSTEDAQYFYRLVERAAKDKEHYKNRISFYSFDEYINNKEVEIKETDIVIDAIFGTGLNKALRHDVDRIIAKLNDTKSGLKISVDIPSGVFGDGSFFYHNAFKADYTLTFGSYKTGHLLEPGVHFSDEVHVFSIGFYKNIKKGGSLFSAQKVTPLRTPGGNKYSSGVLHIIGGSRSMEGAAVLSGVSFLKSGGGLAKIFSTSSDVKKALGEYPQLMIESSGEKKVLDLAIEALISKPRNRVLVIGPGLSMEDRESYREFFHSIFSLEDLLCVMDASVFSEITHFENEIKNRKNGSLLFTPHIKEAERILGRPVQNIRLDAIEISKRFNVNIYFKGAGGLVILKDETTIDENAQIKEIYLNDSRYELATGGSGDILTGIAAASVYRCRQKNPSGRLFWNECMINQMFSYYYALSDETIKSRSELCFNKKDWFFADMSIRNGISQ